MEDYKEKLDEIEQAIQEKKEEKIRLTTKKTQLEEQKTELLAELSGLDLTEEKLTEEINKLEKEIKEELSKCETILSGEEDD